MLFILRWRRWRALTGRCITWPDIFEQMMKPHHLIVLSLVKGLWAYCIEDWRIKMTNKNNDIRYYSCLEIWWVSSFRASYRSRKQGKLFQLKLLGNPSRHWNDIQEEFHWESVIVAFSIHQRIHWNQMKHFYRMWSNVSLKEQLMQNYIQE